MSGEWVEFKATLDQLNQDARFCIKEFKKWVDECGFTIWFRFFFCLPLLLLVHYSTKMNGSNAKFPWISFAWDCRLLECSIADFISFVITAPSNSYHSQLFCLDVLNLRNKLVRFNYVYTNSSPSKTTELRWQRPTFHLIRHPSPLT